MNFFSTAIAFVVALGSLIVFHELGHYWVARWCNVKVLRFSLGMGRIVWSRRYGPDQTEWAISALPIGGYVKMLDGRDQDQDLAALPAHELAREFTRQSVWRRIAIVAAGPLANFLLAIVVFCGLYLHGVAEFSSKVSVAASSVADQAGLRANDVIVAVNGKPVSAMSEVRWQVIQAALDKENARLTLERAGQGRLNATLSADRLAGLDPDSDVLQTLGIGVAVPPAVLGEIVPNGAAARAGLQTGDAIVSLADQPVPDFAVLVKLVRAAPAKPLAVVLRRAGQEHSVTLTPEPERAPGITSTAVTVGKIGAGPAQGADMISLGSSPMQALSRSVVKVWDTSVMTVKMMGMMVTGQLSLKNVTGPITIADYAGQTARSGALTYLSFIALISISLGVMNLLPIPVLDGGLLLYYSLEVLTGRPLPERFTNLAQVVGIGLLVSLMALAVFNDVGRLLD